jgi:hypothetical protein
VDGVTVVTFPQFFIETRRHEILKNKAHVLATSGIDELVESKVESPALSER